MPIARMLANSLRLALPRITAPAARSRATSVASRLAHASAPAGPAPPPAGRAARPAPPAGRGGGGFLPPPAARAVAGRHADREDVGDLAQIGLAEDPRPRGARRGARRRLASGARRGVRQT